MFVYFFFETESLCAALVVWDLPCRKGYPETPRDPLASTSRMLGLKVNTTTFGKTDVLQFLFPCVCGCLCGSTALVSRSLWRPEGGTETRITHDCEGPRGWQGIEPTT